MFWITGDLHGDFSRFNTFAKDKNWNVIVLGDAGVNFWLSKRDEKLKRDICKDYSNIYFYLVRGNHEERPEYISGIEMIYDEQVKGYVYIQKEFPNIKYFIDGNEYEIEGLKTLVIGGAYSVDKWYRLEKQTMGCYGGWFPGEQLSEEEMKKISNTHKGKAFDLILSHTCPISYQPRDLFLGFVDQSKVDNSMELWLEEFKNEINWKVWLFGHYHDDRLERPRVEMYYHDIDRLQEIVKRWDKYAETGELDWWLEKSPNFYMGE